MFATLRQCALIRTFFLLSFVAVVTACGPPTLDTSSLEALNESLTSMREKTAPEELLLFEESLRYLVRGSVPSETPEDPDRGKLILDIIKPLSGRTAEGIVAEARLQRLSEVQEAVSALEELSVGADEAREELSKLRLSNTRVFKRHRQFLEWPVFEMAVENATGQTVFLVHFRASLLRRGDADPWLIEEFDHIVIRGFEPAARDLWRIEPKLQEWIQLIDPHPDVMFSVQAMRLEDRGRRVIAETEWGDVEAHKLALFRETLEFLHSSNSLALDRPPKVVIHETEDETEEDG